MSNDDKGLLGWSRFNSGGHPDYAADDSLDLHVAWCVWHEGVPEYRYGSEVDAFRQACMATQEHNGTVRDRIERATNNELNAARAIMSEYFDNPRNGGYQMLLYHIGWVCHHEGRRAELLHLLDAGNFGQIRAIYKSEQDHNPHVHHLIEAARDSTVRSLLDSVK